MGETFNFKSVVSYGLCSQRHIKNHRRTPCFFWLTKWNDTLTSSASEVYSLRTKQEDVLYSTACKFTLFVPCVIPAHEATSIVLGSFLSGDGIADIF